MTEQNLIINGVDHAKFDLEWAKRGGLVLFKTQNEVCKHVAVDACGNHIIAPIIIYGQTHACIEGDLYMATPQECADAGIEYIDPPIRWLPIESAPEDGRIIEVADFRVVVANECPLSKHWKFWRDIPHQLNKNSMTQPPKGE